MDGIYLGQKWEHRESLAIYVIIGFIKVKIGDNWIDHVKYYSLEKGPISQEFGRNESDFRKKFKQMKEVKNI